MKRYPVKAKRRAIEPVAVAPADVVPARSRASSFDFRYSSTSISLEGGRAHLKVRRARSTDGTLESESFEGEVDRSLFEEAQRQFAAQTAFFWQSFASWLPFHRRRGGDFD